MAVARSYTRKNISEIKSRLHGFFCEWQWCVTVPVEIVNYICVVLICFANDSGAFLHS